MVLSLEAGLNITRSVFCVFVLCVMCLIKCNCSTYHLRFTPKPTLSSLGSV